MSEGQKRGHPKDPISALLLLQVEREGPKQGPYYGSEYGPKNKPQIFRKLALGNASDKKPCNYWLSPGGWLFLGGFATLALAPLQGPTLVVTLPSVAFCPLILPIKYF